MDEKQTKPFQLSFNGLLKVDFQGSHVTSDGGLILVRELDERLGLGALIEEHLTDSRQGTNKQFTLADLLRQSVYSRLAGYEDLNDAERVSIDPTVRLIGSQKIWDRGAALTSTLHGFETEMLASEENLLRLMALNRELVGQAEACDGSERVVLDIVSNMTLPSRSVVRFYNKRGTAEQWIKEGKQATHWTRLSCHRFRANEVRLQLSVLVYNLGNLWRRLGLPGRIKSWSLTSLQHRLMKTGGRLIKHARYYWLLLAEGYLNRKLLGDMLGRIWALPVPGG